jgi:uncharacterized membrane protein
MNPLINFARPGYILALLALVLGLAFVITGSAEAAIAIAILEAALWASVQYFKDRRARQLKRHA